MLNSEGSLLWTEQIGTDENDVALGLTTDPFGNSFVAGFTQGGLDGLNAGNLDAFLFKNSAGVPEPRTACLMGIYTFALIFWTRRDRRCAP